MGGEILLTLFLYFFYDAKRIDTSEGDDGMKLRRLNLQLFAEGGESGAGNPADVSASGTAETGRKGDLSQVVYGKPAQDLASPPTEDTTKASKETKAQAFENLIKGEYKDEFAKRTQGIIDSRFRETKQMQETLKSHENLIGMLADKYGTDASDINALTKAIEDDESFYQSEAMEKGLTVAQLKELKALQRENEQFRKAEEEAAQRYMEHQAYAKWTGEAEALKAKYGLANFDLATECQNPEFTQLLRHGISVETAYMALHSDEILPVAMAKTADQVKSQMAKSIGQRASRPAENGTSSNSATNFKSDVNSLTKADRDEISRRVARGETISF